MITSGSAGSDARLVYDDGWDSSGDEEEGEGSAVGDDDSWSRCASEAGEEVDEGGLIPGLSGLSVLGGEEEPEGEPALEEDEEEEEDDFLNLTGHR